MWHIWRRQYTPNPAPSVFTKFCNITSKYCIVTVPNIAPPQPTCVETRELCVWVGYVVQYVCACVYSKDIRIHIHKLAFWKNCGLRKLPALKDALKGQCHEIFCFWFFSWISFPQAPDYTIMVVSNFFDNSRRYSQLKGCHRCQQRRWQMEKTFKQKNFNSFVWTPLGSRVNT